jgi:hypothetical protein
VQPEQPEHDIRGVVQDQARPGWAVSQHDQLAGRGPVDELQAGKLEVNLAGIDRQGRDRVLSRSTVSRSARPDSRSPVRAESRLTANPAVGTGRACSRATASADGGALRRAAGPDR